MILLLIVILALVGVVSAWPRSRSWGYGPGDGLGLIVIMLIILPLMGRLQQSWVRASATTVVGAATLERTRFAHALPHAFRPCHCG
jgi:hypothetical protein